MPLVAKLVALTLGVALTLPAVTAGADPGEAGPGSKAKAAAESEGPTEPKPKPERRRSRRAEKREQGPPPVGALSSGGTDRGGFEFLLGSVTMVIAGTLGVVGGFTLATGLRRQDECVHDFVTYCDVVSPRLDLAAAGLSWAVMVPLTVAGGLLLAKGRRIRRDFKRFHAGPSTVSLQASERGAGLSWSLRF